MYNVFKEEITFKNYEVLDYNRKSRADDKHMSVEEVLSMHNKILEEYANDYLGGPLPEENRFREVGSSETIDSRPEMLRLLKTIERPDVKAILVVEVQRLSRGDLEDAGRLIKILRYTNTQVITPMKTYDLRDEYDRDAFERELKRGNEYLEYFKKIQARGRLASVKAGNYLGSVAPYGYDRTFVKDGKKECPTLIEKKDEADIVRLIFQWYCEDDVGTVEICNRLNEMGAKTPGGKKFWKTNTVFTILENIHYIGCVRWNWRKTIKIIEDQEIRELRPKAEVGEYLIFNGKHDGIISKEQFEKAQRIKGSRHRTKTNTTLQNPFSGLIYCKCGKKMGYNTFRKRGLIYSPPIIKCHYQKYCKNGSASFFEILDYVCRTLEDCIQDFETRIENKQDNSARLHAELIKNLEKKLEELTEQEILQWEGQYHPDESKRIPAHVFKILNEKLLAEKAEINDALCKAKESAPKQIDYKEQVLKFTDALNALKDPDLPAKIKNQYLREIIERMDYERPPHIRKAMGRHKGFWTESEPFKLSITLRV